MAKLNEAVQLFAGDGLGGGVEWNDVAAHVGTKTTKECCSQWNRSARAGNKELVSRMPRIRTDPWDEMEERALYMGVEACREPASDAQGDHGEFVNVNWDKISAEYLNHVRTPKQCAKKWETIVRNKMREDMKLAADLEHYQGGGSSAEARERGLKSGIWTAADDDRLMEAVALYEGQGRGGAVDWGQVCEYVGNGRTYDQCRIRYNGVVKILKQKGACVKSGAWEPAEVGRREQEPLSVYVWRLTTCGGGVCCVCVFRMRSSSMRWPSIKGRVGGEASTGTKLVSISMESAHPTNVTPTGALC